VTEASLSTFGPQERAPIARHASSNDAINPRSGRCRAWNLLEVRYAYDFRSCQTLLLVRKVKDCSCYTGTACARLPVLFGTRRVIIINVHMSRSIESRLGWPAAKEPTHLMGLPSSRLQPS
jgi:hypothetical protein